MTATAWEPLALPPEVAPHEWRRVGATVEIRPVDPDVTFTHHYEATAPERGDAASTLASHRWTPEEAARVEEAIRTVAARWKGVYRGISEDRPHSEPTGCFTTADVWAELGEGFPVTKGIAAKMTAAARADVIENTGRHAYNDHPDRAHAHGQRLTVWRAR